jgi:hypothetical protein
VKYYVPFNVSVVRIDNVHYGDSFNDLDDLSNANYVDIAHYCDRFHFVNDIKNYFLVTNVSFIVRNSDFIVIAHSIIYRIDCPDYPAIVLINLSIR